MPRKPPGEDVRLCVRGRECVNKSWSEQPIDDQREQRDPREQRHRRDLVEELESRRLMSASGDVALIDTSLPEFQDLSAAVTERDNVILYDGRSESAAKVLGKLAKWAAATNQQIHNVSILSHGKAGAFQLGRDWITSARRTGPARAARWWRVRLTDDQAPSIGDQREKAGTEASR